MNRKLIDFCGVNNIPKTNFANCTLHWLASDSEDIYKKNGNPLFNSIPIEYKFNSYGYRCAEFDVAADERILVVGCSHTLALGMPQHLSWPNLFCEKIKELYGRSCVLWNLGMFGESNDYIGRLLNSATPKLNPTIVIVLFTGFARREYFDLYGNRMNLGPFSLHDKYKDYRKEIVASYFNLQSDYADAMNFAKNYYLIENVLNAGNVRWLFSFPHTEIEMVKKIEPLVDNTKYVKAHLRHSDLARDNSHPGLQSSRLFAQDLYKKYCEIYN